MSAKWRCPPTSAREPMASDLPPCRFFWCARFTTAPSLCGRDTGVRMSRGSRGSQGSGVNRGYTVTTGVWARSILQHEYGVDLKRITWIVSGDEHVAEYKPPPNVLPIEPGEDMPALVASGELAAGIGLDADVARAAYADSRCCRRRFQGIARPWPLSDQPSDRGQGRNPGCPSWSCGRSVRHVRASQARVTSTH